MEEDGVGDEDDNDAEDFECVLCLGRGRGYIFIPCGYLCACENCEVYLERCPICRVPGERYKMYFVN